METTKRPLILPLTYYWSEHFSTWVIRDGNNHQIGQVDTEEKSRLIVTACNNFHTGEIWKVIDRAIITDTLNDYGNFVVVEIKREWTAQDRDNLERIVADHNALVGLDPSAIRGLVEAAEKVLLHRFLNDLHPIDYGRLKEALSALKEGK